jgi:hypothetical protein
VKAKPFKQFVSEAIRPKSADLSVEVEECIFLIDGIIYSTMINVDATIEIEADDYEHEYAGVSYWWLTDIVFCEKFKDPEINQLVLDDLSLVTNLYSYGLNDSPAQTKDSLIFDALFKYEMVNVENPEFSQVLETLKSQVTSSNSTRQYTELTSDFISRVEDALYNEIKRMEKDRIEGSYEW